MRQASVGIESSSALAHRLMGIQRYISQLTASMARLILDEPAINIELIYRISRFRKHRLRPGLAIDHRWYWPLPGLGARHYDLVHALDTTLPWPFSRKMICTVHDLYTLIDDRHAGTRVQKKCLRDLQYITRHCDVIIVPSQSTRSDLVKYTNYPEDRIIVVPLGVEDRFFESSSNHPVPLVLPGQQAGSYILAYSGGRKNLVSIIHAYHEFELYRDYQLHVIGTLDTVSRQFVEENGLEGQVIELGVVDDVDMPAIYSGAALLCFPSLYEGFGLPVLEGMAAGIPVLTSAISATAEIGGEHVVLVDPASVEEIGHGMMKALDLGDGVLLKALECARTYSWDRTAMETLEVYRNVLGN